MNECIFAIPLHCQMILIEFISGSPFYQKVKLDAHFVDELVPSSGDGSLTRRLRAFEVEESMLGRGGTRGLGRTVCHSRNEVLRSSVKVY